ncbi:HEXXH motif domain-containing protein [Nonomuraea sp. NPDC050663]|uniref:HEXXH motif domain-containing protein n=1 Tax=Nonomuraea sp. NPDC050663 TaxID=3364370 RepID=UPI0037B2B91C
MELGLHELPARAFDLLAAGAGGADAAALLVAAQHSKNRTLITGIADQAESAQPGFQLLAEMAREAPDAVRAVITYPAVGLWALRTLRALLHGERVMVEPARLGAVAAAAAVHARVDCRIQVPTDGNGLTMPSVGRVMTGVTGLVEIEVRDGALSVDGRFVDIPQDREWWVPLRRIGVQGGPCFVIDDLDPHRWPQTEELRDRLSGAEVATWQSCLDEAWGLLAKDHWTIAMESQLILSAFVPISAPAGSQNSASSRTAFGAMAASTPFDGLWLASTLAHEVQHAKLGAILDMTPLTRPDERRYYAPWRPDPRPLSGLLQGTYAYLGVAGFWRRQREADNEPRSHAEFAHWRRSAFDACRTLLDSERLTPQGERFVMGMTRTLSTWLDEAVPGDALMEAHRQAEAHRVAWTSRNGRPATAPLDRSPS